MRPMLLALVTLLSTACGSAGEGFVLFDASDKTAKTPCNYDDGFLVCLSEESRITDSSLKSLVSEALGRLVLLVNDDDFKAAAARKYANGAAIVEVLRTTNYRATVTSYCNAQDTALAKATVGGVAIRYNACKGERNVAHVAGVLLHEISHNVGFDHAAVNPSRSSVPYWLGDLATSQLGGTVDERFHPH